jgi:hypothetical protein
LPIVEQIYLCSETPQEDGPFNAQKPRALNNTGWPAPGSEYTELGVLMEPGAGHAGRKDFESDEKNGWGVKTEICDCGDQIGPSSG